MNSLDPRVTRLPAAEGTGPLPPKEKLDQFGTFEVFVKPNEKKPFAHEGAVHAPELAMAFILAKETFTRRFTCLSLYVTDTRDVFISAFTEGGQNAYDTISASRVSDSPLTSYEIYHLAKRGKQHLHVGTVMAAGSEDALFKAKEKFGTGQPVQNIWAIRTDHIHFTTEEENDFWLTLPDKKFRDAAAYKGGDKLKLFLETRGQQVKPS